MIAAGMLIENVSIQCPYCGESIDIVVDASIDRQDYIEDCSVCCRPMEMSVSISSEGISVVPRRDDE